MNQAVFLALLEPGDSFMGLDLNSGGHLTHGSPVNMSGKWFKPIPYGVREDDHLIDMDEVARLAREHKPKLIIAGGTAYSRVWDFPRFPRDRRRSGRVAAGRHVALLRPCRRRRAPSPFPHAHVVTTTTHKRCAAAFGRGPDQ
jgi:glycine hydroxymethyltransferase